MGHFLNHAPCPRCNSRDNLGIYSDGGEYCFGCGYIAKSIRSPYLSKEKVNDNRKSTDLPSDCTHIIGEPAYSWLSKYINVTGLLCLTRRISYRIQSRQLIFSFTGENGKTILWQARNFSSLFKSKYYTCGSTEEILPIYYKSINFVCRPITREKNGNENERPLLEPFSSELEEISKEESETRCNTDGATTYSGRASLLILVEDCVSAIKIAETGVGDSMPCMGSDLSKSRLKRLAGLYGTFVVWLDGNMYPKAQRIADRLQYLGCQAKAVYTPLDPKDYTEEVIVETICKNT
jgi:Zn ribbon nucleic-acid-binding protein